MTTKSLNQAVKRNSERFPDDFAFQLAVGEVASLRSQFAASGSKLAERSKDIQNRSQIVTGSQKHRDPANRPWAFTEHGALVAANILRSEQAVRMSVYVIRAFVHLREAVAGEAERPSRPAATRSISARKSRRRCRSSRAPGR